MSQSKPAQNCPGPDCDGLWKESRATAWLWLVPRRVWPRRGIGYRNTAVIAENLQVLSDKLHRFTGVELIAVDDAPASFGAA